MILDHFWKILFVVAIAVAGFFTWKAHSEKRAFDFKASEIALLIDPQIHTHRTSTSRFEEAIFQAVALLHQHDRDGTHPPEAILDAATGRIATGEDHAELIRTTLMANLDRCRELGIFDEEPRNLDRMRVGRAPTIPIGPWKGESLAVAWIVSPLLAAESLNAFANAGLVPESIRALGDETVTDAVFNHATRLRRAGIIEEPDYQRIRELARAR